MLKTTRSHNKPASSRNDSSRSVSSKNDNSKPVFRKNDGNGKVDGFGISENGMEHAKKSGKTSKSQKLFKSKKLSKSGKSKSEKTSKSWNLAKSRKKLLKSGNPTNFDATEVRPKFLTPDARIAFNHLRLAFTEALILQHFDLECHIWNETDVLDYAIGGVLN